MLPQIPQPKSLFHLLFRPSLDDGVSDVVFNVAVFVKNYGVASVESHFSIVRHVPRLPDLKARHKGQSTWMEVVVNDENYHAEYNQGAPGVKIAAVMHPDTREFYAVMEGQMRFTLEGQPEPIVASAVPFVAEPGSPVACASVDAE